MFIFEQSADIAVDSFSRFSSAPEEVLFLDIETTGFSPDTSYVYLIGCAYIEKENVKIKQWFIENVMQEKELLLAFLTYIKNYRILVHYNGETFDIPYLSKKCKKYGLFDVLFSLGSQDIYKALVPIKKRFNLPDLKQKTLEHLIKYQRKSRFDGRDLITVYQEFTARYRYECLIGQETFLYKAELGGSGLIHMPECPAKALLHTLLLHNVEDITGLAAVSALLVAVEFFSGCFFIKNVSGVFDAEHGSALLTNTNTNANLRPLSPPEALKEGQPYAPEQKEQQKQEEIQFSLSCKNRELFSLIFQPVISRNLPCGKSIVLRIQPDGFFTLSVPVFHGTLKYFFNDYKEYYYLPAEDRAIHKSVAEFVDKAYRKKATKETCYQKKEGCFLPQIEQMFEPAFRESAKSSPAYFLPSAAFWEDEKAVKTWLTSLLCWLV